MRPSSRSSIDDTARAGGVSVQTYASRADATVTSVTADLLAASSRILAPTRR